MNLLQSTYAVAPYIRASFLATGGVGDYTYEVLPDGAGGTIDAETGWYTAPSIWNPDPRHAFDTIRATDENSETAEAQIMVGSPLRLFCDIIQRGMGLPANRVFLYQQKIFQPQDDALYVVVYYGVGKVFGNNNRSSASDDEADLISDQYVAEAATLRVEVLSRSPEALWKKEEVLLALTSEYAQNQQMLNTFYIGRVPPSGRIQNISQRDGAAIPYRFEIPINIQFAYPKSGIIEFFDNFEDPEVFANP